MSPIGSLKSVFEPLKTAAEVLRAADKIPEYQRILEAMQTISDMSEELHEAKAEIRTLKAELENVNADIGRAEGAKVRSGCLWLTGEEEPFCLHCWEKKRRLFHMLPDTAYGFSRLCPECSARVANIVDAVGRRDRTA
jgi:hypothetical protein